MARNTNKGTMVHVTMAAYTTLKYCFKSRLDSSKRPDFGQEVILPTITSVAGFILGANRPKPARASKKIASGYEGSYCSHSKIKELLAAGYSVTPAVASRKGRSTLLTKSSYITINGVKYAWNRSTTVEKEPQEYPANCDIKAPTKDDGDLVWGATFPKPAKVKYIDPGTGNSFGSFCDPLKVDSLDANNWVTVKDANYLVADFARYLSGDSGGGGGGGEG